MKKVLLLMLLVSAPLYAQNWSGILDSSRGIDWSQAGISGGIPSGTWTQSGSTIAASSCGSDCTSTIQTALNACGTNHYVLLGAGTFPLTSGTNLTIPSNCVLRGSGVSTVISLAGTTRNNGILIGSDYGPFGTAVTTYTNITGGATKGSGSITVASASGITVGSLLLITQNDTSYMTQNGYSGGTMPGACTYCDQDIAGMGDSGQTVLVTSVSGTTIGIYPYLYMDYSPNSPRAFPVPSTPVHNAGLENLKITKADNSAIIMRNIEIGAAYNTWVSGVESDFAGDTSNGADHMVIAAAVNNIVQNSYFHDGYKHTGGCCDLTLRIATKASGNLIINNIFWRQHTSILVQWGASGNVIAYNYIDGDYHDSLPAWNIEQLAIGHGTHPMFNLVEGNIIGKTQHDTSYGSTSHTTYFRNWHIGSTKAVPPYNARGTLQTGSYTWEDGNSGAFINGTTTYYTSQIGDIIGSAHLAGLSGVVNSAQPPTAVPNYACSLIGYDDGPAISNNPNASLAISSFFQHGVNNCLTGAITWSGSVTHTLPSSFFLTSQPSWWGSVAWPPIGPDVTGGNVADSVANGHVNAIPALNCFNATTSNGTSNTGTFSPDTCYPTSGGTSNYNLSVGTAGTGSGNLSGLNCTTATYASGTNVTCTATATSGTFAGFTGIGSASGCSTSPCSFSLTGDSTLTATFTASAPSSGGTKVHGKGHGKF